MYVFNQCFRWYFSIFLFQISLIHHIVTNRLFWYWSIKISIRVDVVSLFQFHFFNLTQKIFYVIPRKETLKVFIRSLKAFGAKIKKLKYDFYELNIIYPLRAKNHGFLLRIWSKWEIRFLLPSIQVSKICYIMSGIRFNNNKNILQYFHCPL